MMLSLDTAYRSFGGEVEASNTPTICRLPDSRRHQLSAIARYCMMALLSSATLLKAPRRMRFRVISAKKRSTMLSQDAEVGVKCKWKRGCALSQRFTAGVLWVA